ncbi:hypothetical protein CAT47_12880 [Acinetobacter baumannii]|nr:hypothetical protein CAT47_12880 [Acinetobacter baumannii]
MKNYLIGLVISLGLTGCVVLPNIDYSQPKVERFNPVKNWISVDSASVKDMPNGNEIFKLKGGSEVYVFRYQDEWALLTPASDKQQWINFRYLWALLHKDLKCKAPLIEPNLRRNLGKWST